jgi:hypothetical protein
MKSNPANTPLMRAIARYERKGLSREEAITEAFKKWPNHRLVVCYASQREHRTAATNLAKELIREGKAIDYEYYSQKTMAGETGRADAEARFEITMADDTTPFPWDRAQEHWQALGMVGGFLDCYDDEYRGTFENNPWEHEGGGCMVGDWAQGTELPCDDTFINTETEEKRTYKSTVDAHLTGWGRHGGLVQEDELVAFEGHPDVKRLKNKLLR